MRSWNRDAMRILAILSGLTTANISMATEQVPYQVIESLREDIELRRYQPVLVAQTDIVAGSFREASDIGFRRLAGFIFGDNSGEQKIAMTAPVIMESPMASGQSSGNGIWRMAFAMPSEWSLDSLPTPRRTDVLIRELPARNVAALRFSGRGSDAQFAEAEAQLRQVLDLKSIEAGDASTARYNAPWVPPFLRRNEVLIEIQSPSGPRDVR